MKTLEKIKRSMGMFEGCKPERGFVYPFRYFVDGGVGDNIVGAKHCSVLPEMVCSYHNALLVAIFKYLLLSPNSMHLHLQLPPCLTSTSISAHQKAISDYHVNSHAYGGLIPLFTAGRTRAKALCSNKNL